MKSIKNSEKGTVHSPASWVACAAIVGVAVILFMSAVRPGDRKAATAFTPWKCVGGCGAGGSGGSAADIKWIGEGVSGGFIDAEVISSETYGQNFDYKQIKTRLSMRPTWSTNLGLTIPFVSKTGALQPKTNYDDKTEQTAGIADMMLDISKTLGSEGQYSASLNLTIPTGQYDVKRGKENEMLYLPTTLQRGSGVFNAALGLSRSMDVDKGMWIMEGFFSWPFAINFYGKNQFVNNSQDQFNAVNSRWDLITGDRRKRFEYYFKPYGENDLGGYIPPSITAAVYYANRHQRGYVHSYGAKIWVPLGVAWVPDYSASSYNPTPDPNNKTWSVTLHYGLEFSKPEFPIYVSVNKTILSRSTPNPNDAYDEKALAQWHGPDIKALINDNWVVAVGLKTTMF